MFQQLEAEELVKSFIGSKGFNMKFFWLFCAVCNFFLTSAFGLEGNALLQLAKEAFDARERAGALSNVDASVAAFKKPFEGVDDSEKIEALALYLYDIDKSDSKWSMSAYITTAPISALSSDPEFIKDWSSLREMLRVEKDPRKFYLLSKLVPWTEDKPQLDFVAERVHMLFADGRVAKEEGEYTKEYAHDVSNYTYVAIVGNLRVLGASFEPPPKDLPHEEAAKLLGRWLKENWPGCEGMEIPSSSSVNPRRPRYAENEVGRVPSRGWKSDPISGEEEVGNNARANRSLWVVLGILVFGFTALYLRQRRFAAKS
jgi:hypothetical protein